MTTEQAENVKKYRRTAGCSQEDLAERAGLSTGTIAKLEQGGSVRMETLHAVARALGVHTSQLMASDEPEPVRKEGPQPAEPSRPSYRNLSKRSRQVDRSNAVLGSAGRLVPAG